MSANPQANAIPEQSGDTDASLNGAGVLEHAQCLWHEFIQLSQERFSLAALETQRAGESLVAMLVAGVLMAILLVSAWLGLLAAVVLSLIEQGLLASCAMLVAVVGNLLLALICYGVIRRERRYLQFPATRRSFKPLAIKQAIPRNSDDKV